MVLINNINILKKKKIKILFARDRGKYNKIRAINCTSSSKWGWAAVWPRSTWVVGGNHEMKTGLTQLQPCLAPRGRSLRSSPTGPSWELSGSHKTILDFVCFPEDVRETCSSAWAASCFSGLRHLLRHEPSSESRQITTLAFWDMDADILMVTKYSCFILLNETCCWAGRQC